MTKKNITLGLIVIGVVNIGMHMPVLAQSMYRCGSTYQDHPCEGTQKGGKLIGGIGVSSSSSGSGTVSNAVCAKRGADAQKIVWAREGGAMLNQQLAKANSASERQLINDVYAIRGTSTDIRAAIEADCIATWERSTQAPSSFDTSRGTSLSASGTENKPMEANQNAGNSGGYDRAAQEAAQKKIRCNNMSNQLANVVSQQRGGADGRTMDSLTQQSRDLQQRLRAEQCQ